MDGCSTYILWEYDQLAISNHVWYVSKRHDQNMRHVLLIMPRKEYSRYKEIKELLFDWKYIMMYEFDMKFAMSEKK